MERIELFRQIQKPVLREITREDGSKATQFEGYAIVFNEPSVVMLDWWEDKIYREYILPEAIDQKMLDTTDIICTAFHNREKLLARHHADGTGTLTLTKDSFGVKVQFEFPDSPTGKDIMESVRRGDMPGMSFSFYSTDYEYTDKKGADGIYERTITKIDSIFEVTVAASPAYPATTASCREAWQADRAESIRKREEEEAAKAAAAKAEEEAKAKAAQEAAEREKFTRERTSTAMRMELDLLNY